MILWRLEVVVLGVLGVLSILELLGRLVVLVILEILELSMNEIVTKLDAVREKCAKLKSAAEEGLKTAALLRKAILKEAFE